MPRGYPTHRWRGSGSFRTKIGKSVGPMERRESWIQFAALDWRPFNPSRSLFSLGFRAMVRRAESPPINVHRFSVSSSPPSHRTLYVNLPPHRPPRGGELLHAHHQCHVQTVRPRCPRVSRQMRTRLTTSSPSFGERWSICHPSIRILTGKKVDWVFVDEHRRTWELYFLCFCARLCRGSTWNRELYRSRPDRKRCPNSCLVCFDRQLFLCPTPPEGTLRKGKPRELHIL